MVGAPLGLHNSFRPYVGEGVCSSHLALSGPGSPRVAAACVTKCSLCVHIRLMTCLQPFFTPPPPPLNLEDVVQLVLFNLLLISAIYCAACC